MSGPAHCTLSFAMSLDGFIADPDGGVDWLSIGTDPNAPDDGWFDTFMSRIDALVMGRASFETVVSFGVWPYSKPVFVRSRTMNAVPAGYEDKASAISGNPHEIVSSLSQQGFHRLYVDGGKTAQAFLAADLIDEMMIAYVPVLLGKGIQLFGSLSHRLEFRHLETQTMSIGLAQSRYERARQ